MRMAVWLELHMYIITVILKYIQSHTIGKCCPENLCVDE